MSKANEIQHGGTHYKKQKTQHWDFVVDNGMGYLEGCATKYLSRHHNKNGLEDVLKAQHYVTKILEKHVDQDYQNGFHGAPQVVEEFVLGSDMDGLTSDAFMAVVYWNNRDHLKAALAVIDALILHYRHRGFDSSLR